MTRPRRLQQAREAALAVYAAAARRHAARAAKWKRLRDATTRLLRAEMRRVRR